MKKEKLFLLILIGAMLILTASCDKKPYVLKDSYMFIQKEERRNDSAKWQLVWEDDFNKGALDTNTWRRIGLFETPKWKVPVERWRNVKNCFRYITVTDPRVIQFDESNIHRSAV